MLIDVFRDTECDDDVDKMSTNDEASKFYGYMEDTNEGIIRLVTSPS